MGEEAPTNLGPPENRGGAAAPPTGIQTRGGLSLDCIRIATNPGLLPAARARVGEMAVDHGRLRRHLERLEHSGADYTTFLLDRVGGHVLSLDELVQPSAAEVIAFVTGSTDWGVEAVLASVDEHDDHLRRVLGVGNRV